MTLRVRAPASFVAAFLAAAVVVATATAAPSSTPASTPSSTSASTLTSTPTSTPTPTPTKAPQPPSTSLRPARLKPSLDVRRGNQSNNHKNISQLLDDLLRGYDNSVRPNLGGPPAVVEVDIMVRSMGPVSEVDMTYSMDCYFRQSWVDRRLAFRGSKETLALSISMLKRIWKPDTFFYNGKQSYLHTITTPNKFVRLYQDGRVLYSSRLTIKAGCPMHLEDFPMDTQRCPLTFGSFGYSIRDVLYRWNRARQVAIAEDMKLSQFDLIATPAGNRTDRLKSGNHSMLLVSFHLRRHMGNFLIQVYGPCVLLVVLSWVSFWLNREATADRVSLGITTVLTMTFLGLEARTDLPKVAYPTALDFFVFLSFAFIFATIIQFAVVHYFTKYGSGECYYGVDSESCSDEDDDEVATIPTGVIPLHAGTLPPPVTSRPPATVSGFCLGRRRPRYPVGAAASAAAAAAAAMRRRGASAAVAAAAAAGCAPTQPRAPRFNSVSQIDRASRVVFPLCFLSINVAYWGLYLARSQRVG